jgi:hypothetical protein
MTLSTNILAVRRNHLAHFFGGRDEPPDIVQQRGEDDFHVMSVFCRLGGKVCAL